MLQIQQSWALKVIKKQLFELDVVREAGVLGECIAVNNVVEGMRQEDVSIESQRLQKTSLPEIRNISVKVEFYWGKRGNIGYILKRLYECFWKSYPLDSSSFCRYISGSWLFLPILMGLMVWTDKSLKTQNALKNLACMNQFILRNSTSSCFL